MIASLIEDGGEAASEDEFFRSLEYLAAEGATHTLALGDPDAPQFAAPLIVRDIPAAVEHRDAISPYGYPGARLSGEPPFDPGEIDWPPTGLVSVFLRDRIAAVPSLAQSNARGRVQVADPALESGVRPRLLEQIRATERLGYRVERLSGPDAGESDRGSFERAYTETMRRTGAAERYFFGPSYFGLVLKSPRSWLLLARAPSGEPAAGAIAVLSDGLLHYFLGGTADAQLESSPMKNLFVGMIEQARELGVPLNLGGGVEAGDGLERFKRGFANSELPFHTAELVADPAVYERLSANADAEPGFFPRYRA